jgi:snRNA-activating protein complex subunit 3
MRPTRNSDQNVFTEIVSNINIRDLLFADPFQKRNISVDSPESQQSATQDVLITITVHGRVPWGHGALARLSQHAVLASQTLADLFAVIPCPSKESFDEILEDGDLLEHEKTHNQNNSNGCVMCIEGLAYGDSQTQPDYAE